MRKKLTGRQVDVVRSIMAGNTTYEKIAADLRLSVGTVRSHMHLVYFAVGAENMADVILMAIGFKHSPCDVDVRSEIAT